MPLLTPQLAQQRAGQPMLTQTVPAPVMGLNTRDSLTIMPATDASVFKNVVPTENGVESRTGYAADFATGFSDDVETIIDFDYESGHKMVAASGSVIYTVPDIGGTASSIKTGMSNARYQHEIFNKNLVMLNGADTPQTYDGSAVADLSASGTGLTLSDLIGVCNFKGRAIYWEDDSSDFWYAASGAFAGSLTKFELGQIATRGGTIVDIKTWTRDSGSGPDDFFVAMMSTGEVIVYQGTDPGDASAWSLVGRYYLPAAFDIRGQVDYGPDIFMLTKSDVVTFTDALQKGRTQEGASKLAGVIKEMYRLYGDNYGWQAVFYPNQNWILFNIPIITDSKYVQYGIHTITGGAFHFTGWNARCFGVYKDQLYMGGNQVIHKADSGLDDAGADIDVDVVQAFSNLGSTVQKRFGQFRPIFDADGNVTFSIGLAVDYGEAILQQAISSVSTGITWDDYYWDEEFWTPENRARALVYTAGGEGRNVSVRVKASLNGQQIRWYETGYAYQPLSRFH